MKKKEIVTLDGPSGVGKSTISRKIAAILGYSYLDTGAMYRAVGLYLQRHEVDIDNSEAVTTCLENISIRLLPAEKEEGETGVLLNNEEVSKKIRTPEMSMLASKVSALPEVRAKLTEMQREIAIQGKIVAEGRDIGTVVFPDAAHKFFLDADVEERARRRIRQLDLDGDRATEERILEMIRKRDRDDSERSVAPLKKADDALLIDTTCITIDEVCEKILQKIKTETR
jgi:CMP/dCMP kinase